MRNAKCEVRNEVVRGQESGAGFVTLSVEFISCKWQVSER